MKTYNIPILKISILTLFILLSVLILSSCEQKRAQSEETIVQTNLDEFPQLLIRQGPLSETEEWQKTIQAVGKINQRLEANNKDAKACLQLAEIFINEARITGEHGYYYPAILKIVDRVIAMKSEDSDIQFRSLSLKSSVLLSLHQFEKAREIASQAVKINLYNAQIYGALTDANVELGDYEQALSNAGKMMDLRPDLLSYSRASYLREIHGDMKGAIVAMELAVSSGFPGYENMAWTRLTLGHLYENSGDLMAAENQYKTALQERPGYPFAIAGLASIEEKKGNRTEAEKLLNEAIAIIPEVSFYIDLAKIYNKTGRAAQAQETINETIAMMADDELHGHIMDIEYAKVYLNLTHDYKAALVRANKEYAARPANIDVNKIMAQIHYKLGNINEADKHLSAAMRTGSQNPELLMIAGLIYQKSGKNELALQMINKSRSIDPYQEGQFVNEAKPMLAVK